MDTPSWSKSKTILICFPDIKFHCLPLYVLIMVRMKIKESNMSRAPHAIAKSTLEVVHKHHDKCMCHSHKLLQNLHRVSALENSVYKKQCKSFVWIRHITTWKTGCIFTLLSHLWSLSDHQTLTQAQQVTKRRGNSQPPHPIGSKSWLLWAGGSEYYDHIMPMYTGSEALG